MSIFAQFKVVSERDKTTAVEKLIADSTPDFDFFLFIVLSVLMATFGLLIDNVAVLIGSMLIAPLLSPILSFSLGLVLSDHKIIYRSFYTVLKAFVMGTFAAFVAALLFVPLNDQPSYEILIQTIPSLEYFAVAMIAGLAVSFSVVKPHLSTTLSGIAVSVALIPPLAVLGIGLAQFNWGLVSGSFVLFLLNVVGIVFASMVSFSLMDFKNKHRAAKETVKKEEKRLEREHDKIEKIEKESS